MIIDITIQQAICDQCGFKWNLHKVIPIKCGRCQTKKWNEHSTATAIRITEEVNIPIVATKKKTIQDLQDLINKVPVKSPQLETPVEEEEVWIYLPNTFENGEILYWRKKPKQLPECYKRESDLGI